MTLSILLFTQILVVVIVVLQTFLLLKKKAPILINESLKQSPEKFGYCNSSIKVSDLPISEMNPGVTVRGTGMLI